MNREAFSSTAKNKRIARRESKAGMCGNRFLTIAAIRDCGVRGTIMGKTQTELIEILKERMGDIDRIVNANGKFR